MVRILATSVAYSGAVGTVDNTWHSSCQRRRSLPDARDGAAAGEPMKISWGYGRLEIEWTALEFTPVASQRLADENSRSNIRIRTEVNCTKSHLRFVILMTDTWRVKCCVIIIIIIIMSAYIVAVVSRPDAAAYSTSSSFIRIKIKTCRTQRLPFKRH